MVGIYKIASPTGKVYIGQSWDIEKRLSQYKGAHCKAQPKLHNSINKYGFDQHLFLIIHLLPSDIEQGVLDQYEQMYMDSYRDCGVVLMNIREAGSRGKHSKETVEKMRNNNGKWMLGRKLSNETKTKIGKASIGNKHNLGRSPSYQTRQKISVINKGRVSPFKGGSHSEQHKKELAQKMKGNKHGEGKKWTTEQRLKMMTSRGRPWNKGSKGLQSHDEEWRAAASKRMSGENHPMAKLTNDQLNLLAIRYANGEKIIDLAKETPVTYSHLRKLLKNKKQ